MSNFVLTSPKDIHRSFVIEAPVSNFTSEYYLDIVEGKKVGNAPKGERNKMSGLSYVVNRYIECKSIKKST